ncbi:hypothetical protein DPM33_12610 [Mesorhizobium hawassense]|uniref:Uncharacterized protein n=1 Tax=Mesorhizobium hawassense TaxID=1209954 RepID=A0A330I052_9HYPH|nr:hypothetical protein DPM33_12610 [Mesorhizobium hawassense]
MNRAISSFWLNSERGPRQGRGACPLHDAGKRGLASACRKPPSGIAAFNPDAQSSPPLSPPPSWLPLSPPPSWLPLSPPPSWLPSSPLSWSSSPWSPSCEPEVAPLPFCPPSSFSAASWSSPTLDVLT